MVETVALGCYILPAILSAGLVALAGALGRRRAALRHRVLSLGIATALGLPLATALVPASLQWRLPVGTGAPGSVVMARRSVDPETERSLASPTGSPGPGQRRAGIGAPSERQEGRATDQSLPHVDAIPIWFWLVAISGLGSLGTGILRLRETAALRRLAARASPSSPLSAEVAVLARRLGVDRPVETLVSDDIDVPITWGTRRPRIALPVRTEGWDSPRRELAILHELAHVRRGDAATLTLIRIAKTAYWWNPLVWWLGATAQDDAEVASDSLVMETGISPLVYARALVATVRSARARVASAPAVSLTGSLSLSERLEELCRRDRRPGLLSRRMAWLLLVASVACGSAIAASRISPPSVPSAHEVDTGLGVERPLPGRPLSATSLERVQAAVLERLADSDPLVRRSAVNAVRDLEVTGYQRDRRVLDLLDDPDPEVRVTTARVLGLAAAEPNLRLASAPRHLRLPPSGEMARLRRQLTSTHPLERERAVRTLKQLDDPDVQRLLVDALDDDSQHVRQAAAGALGDVGAGESVPALARALKDPNDHVRQAAAGSLGRIGPAAAPTLSALRATSRDPNDHVRQAAVDAIGDIGDETAQAVLLAALEDLNPFVRQSALNSLVELHRASQ